MASEKVLGLIEEVKALTVLELSELVKALEEEFGVSAAAPVAVAAAPVAAAVVEEKTEFDVILMAAGAEKIKVIKTVREIKDVAVLEDLNQIWTNRITVQPSPDQTFTHKVDVSTGTTSARWLYDPRGYATLLSYARMPIYHFNDAEKLRRILIPQQTNVPYSSPAPQVQRQ